MIERDDLAAWLRLLGAPQVGREAARKLLAAFGSPEVVLQAPEAAQRRVAGVAVPAEPDAEMSALIESTSQWLDTAEDARRHILTLGDAAYPPHWLEMADPPLLLYAQGRLELLQAPCFAIVGSRNATPQGIENARAFAAQLSRAGLTIVSGMALGVDGAAHGGALDGQAGTIAIVGTGLDRVYPRQHRALAHRIVQHGLLLSEYPIGTPPLPAHFPQRNRLIAGLSLGTLVVEAALQSGSLITARLASECGRDVFAIPGSIHSTQSRGCHALIKQGAKLVESAQDILEELRLESPPSAARRPADTAASADAVEDAVLSALGHDPVTLDALVARTGWPTPELQARLLELELIGEVSRLPGQLFQRLRLT